MDQILKQLTDFSTNLRYADLPANAVTAAKERLLDTLGCALGAHDCDIAEIGRALAGPAPRPDLAGRFTGSKDTAAADTVAFTNSCMIRKLDFNDTYPGGHPSDSMGAFFAVGPQVGASGQDLITATVIAYEIFIRFQMKGQLREKGWDNGYGIGVGVAAALSNMLKLGPEKTRHAIALTATGNVPMRASRAGMLSMWKGAATAYAVRNAVFAVQLAAEGMTGPEAPFTGRHGLTDLITGPIELPAFGKEPEQFFIPRAKIKFWPVVYNMQALVWAGIELHKQVKAEDLAEVDVQTYWSAWHESGSEPAKWDPQTQETADHSLPYIMSWVLRHGTVDHHAFVPESYLDPTIRPLMNIVKARIDDDIEKEFPNVIRMRVTATDKSGKKYNVEVKNPLGHEANPVSMAQLGDKFTRLAAPVIGADRTAKALAHWREIEKSPNLAQSFDLVDIDTAPAKAAKRASA